MNGRITCTDGNSVLSVVTDRSQGGSSMVDGSVELMIQRRLQTDDRRGVGEPLNEPGLDATGSGLIVRGLHRVSLTPTATAAAVGKAALQDVTFRPQLTFSSLSSTTPTQWLSAHTGTFSGLAAPLPANVHLLTLQALSSTTVLVRLAHLFEVDEDAALSKPVNVDLSTILGPSVAPLSACEERTTPGAKPLASVRIMTVDIEGEGASTWPTLPAPPAGAAQTVTLNPMDIRTFACTA